MRTVIVALVSACVAATAHAQERPAVLTGRVLDASDSGGIAYAQVQVDGARSIRADHLGHFTVEVSPGQRRIAIRMLGYAPLTRGMAFAAGETATRDFYLVRVPRLLSEMVVKGKSRRVPSGYEDVYRRAAMNAGTFLTREQIDSLNPRDITGLLHEVPFVHVNPNAQAPDRLSTSRCSGWIPGTVANGQSIGVWFNGAPVTDALWLDELLTGVSPSTIQAVEVYNGPTAVPPTFKPACAAIAIWTRRG